MRRTSQTLTRPPAVVDSRTLVSAPGRQIDWDKVPAQYAATSVKVTVDGVNSADATTLNVTALPAALPQGAVIGFGSKKFARLTLPALAGAVALTVEALPVAFAGAEVGYYQGTGKKFVPPLTVMAEVSGGKIVPRSLASAGTATSAVKASGANTGNGTMGAITITGTPQPGVYRLRITRVAANAGDFVITDPNGATLGYGAVAAAFSGGGLAFTLADGSTDFAIGDGFDITVVLTGLTTGAIGLIETGANEDSDTDALTGYGLLIGGVFYENMLPDASGSPKVLPSAYKAELQTVGVGTGFSWQTYADNRS